MTRVIRIVLPALIGAGLLLGGCSTDVVGSEASTLNWVNKAELEAEVMYLDLAVSTQPMSAAEIGDTSFATPIRLGFYEGFAIAWFSPDGEINADREHFVGAWPIYADAADSSGSSAVPVDVGHTGDGVTDVVGGDNTPVIGVDLDRWVAPQERSLQNTGFELPKSELPWAFIDFSPEEFIGEVWPVLEVHPGCL